MGSMLEPSAPAAPRALPGVARWLWLAMAVLGVLVIFTMYAQFVAVASLTRQVDEVSKNVAALQTKATALEERDTAASVRLAELAAKSGQTEEALDRTRAVIDQSRQDHRQLVGRLGGHIENQEKEFSSLTGEVGAVKAEVAGDRRDLQRAVGDLGEQSGLIARNREELEALKRMGDRDYFEFTLRGADSFTRAGPLSLRLNKTDYRRQKYTLTVLADDKQIEKKDRTLLEPVQFYLPGTRSLREIVVYEVGEGRVVGYVSMPKQVVALK